MPPPLCESPDIHLYLEFKSTHFISSQATVAMPQNNAANPQTKSTARQWALVLLQCTILSSSYTAVSPIRLLVLLAVVIILYRTAHHFHVWIP